MKSNFEKKQINDIHQHLIALHSFFQGIRTNLKVLMQHVNPQ